MISTKINPSPPAEAKPRIQFPIIMEMVDKYERGNGQELIALFSNEQTATILHQKNTMREVGEVIDRDVISPYDPYWQPFKGELIMKNS